MKKIVILLSVLFLGAGVCFGLEKGMKAPHFSMESANGEKVTLDKLVGTGAERSVVILSFFDVMCEPCLKELPHIKNLYAKYINDAEVKIRLVNIDEKGKEVVDPYIKKHEVNVPILLDPFGLMAGEKYGVVSAGRAKVPQLFVISKNRVVKEIVTGYKEDLEPFLSSLIETLKAEKVIIELPKKLTIAYTSSTNGYLESCDCPENPFGGLVRRATAIKDLRQKEPALLFVDSGDDLSPYPNEVLPEYVFKIFSMLDYDAMGIGDQEFVNGSSYINNIIEKKPYGELPFLATNLQLCDEKLCWDVTQPYMVKKIGRYNVGILSVVSPDIFAFYPEKITKGLKIKDPVETLNTYIPEVRKKAGIIVIISHSGIEEDKKLAEAVDGIDVIIGGHSQTLLEQPVEINNTLIVQGGENGQRVGKLTLNFSEEGKRVSYNNEFIVLAKTIADDEAVRTLINKYNNRLKKEGEKLLGQ